MTIIVLFHVLAYCEVLLLAPFIRCLQLVLYCCLFIITFVLCYVYMCFPYMLVPFIVMLYYLLLYCF